VSSVFGTDRQTGWGLGRAERRPSARSANRVFATNRTDVRSASAICNLQSAICNLQSAICNLQSAICNLQSAICNLQSAMSYEQL
jgi:hypothetical protein